MTTCRHIFHLIGRKPSKYDVFPLHLKVYAPSYGEQGEEDFTKWCDDRRNMLEDADGMVFPGTLEEIVSSPNTHELKDFNWYMDAHQSVYDQNPFWLGKDADVTDDGISLEDRFSDFTQDTPGLSGRKRPRAKRDKSSSYVRHHREYENVANALRTEEQHDYVSEKLSELLRDVMSMDSSRNQSTGNSTKGGTASLNPTVTTGIYRRQKPIMSPSRHRKH